MSVDLSGMQGAKIRVFVQELRGDNQVAEMLEEAVVFRSAYTGVDGAL